MKLLEFAIPTWKRAKQLRTSVCSIVEKGCPVVISHHACDVETLPVVEQLKKDFPRLVRAVCCELGANPDYSDSFKQVFALSEAKYVWTFGDDDALVPKAFEIIKPLLERDEFDFIHVAEAVRSECTGRLAKGNLIDLCNNLGWIEMTGFISCNIVRTERLNAATQLKSWDLYAKNAFVHCCALLEVLHDRPSAYFDMALVDSKLYLDEDETQKRWIEGNVGLRYHYIDDALMDMRKRGILGTLMPKFFRYHGYHIWDRFLTHIVNSYNTDQDFQLTDYLDEMLTRVINLTSFLDPVNERRYKEEVLEIRQAMIEHCGALAYAIQKAGMLGKLMDYHGREQYDFTYMRPVTTREKA